jgi:hypothetical protein
LVKSPLAPKIVKTHGGGQLAGWCETGLGGLDIVRHDRGDETAPDGGPPVLLIP